MTGVEGLAAVRRGPCPVGGGPTSTILDTWGPRSPCTISQVTTAPWGSVSRPDASTALRWQNTSGEPSSGSRNAPQQARDTPASGPGLDRQPHKSGIALPADLGRSLRLLDDAQFDRLMETVTDDVRRRGRNPPDSPSVGGRSAKRAPPRAAREKPEEPVRAATVIPGQERLILAAFEAGLRPAAIAKEVRVSRSTVQHVITDAQHHRRKTER